MANEIANAELVATKQEIITEVAQRALYAASTTMLSMRDFSNRAIKGAASVSIPKRSARFTTEKRVSGQKGTNQTLSFGKDALLLDQRAHIQWVIDPDDAIESTLDVQSEVVEDAAGAHGEDFDIVAYGEMEAAGIELGAGFTGGVTQDVVLEMRRILGKNKARKNMLFLHIDDTEEARMLKIDPFVSADKYGEAIIPDGVLGTIYGVKVVVSQLLDDGQYYMLEQGGVAYAFQRGPAFDEKKDPEYGVGAMLQVLAQKYGIEAIQKGVPNAVLADGTTALPATTSAHIVKDANA